MKKILLVVFTIFTLFILTACKPKYEKYHEWLYEDIPFQITENITLPLLTEDEKYIIKWRSNNSAVLNDFGVFKEPIDSVEFKLHYTLINKDGEEVYTNSLSCYAVGRSERETGI